MKKYLRRIALLLAAVILFSTVFVACDKDKDEGGNKGGWSLGDSGRSATPDGIPEDTDFNGYQFTALYRAPENYYGYWETVGDIASEQVNPVHRTIYERNMSVEARLNCKIKFVATNETGANEGAAEVRAHLEAEDYYDFFFLTNNLSIGLRSNHLFVDFNDAEYIDYSEPWWWDEPIQELSFDGRTINFLVGDITLNCFLRMSAFYFNFDLVKERLQMQPQDFYDLVNEGKWTIAKVDELSSRCYRDLNGNGEEDDGDLFAFANTGGETVNQFVWSTRILNDLYERDASGLISVKMYGSEDIYQVTTQLKGLLDNQGVYKSTGYDSKIIEDFASGKAVFLPQRLHAAVQTVMHEMQSAYGILPYPTLEEGDEYVTLIQGSSTNISAPKIAEKNLEMIGICIEALCSETYRYAYDEFFNMALKNKYTNDIESAKMVDLIYNTARKSFLLEYDIGGLSGAVNTSVTSNRDVMTLLQERSGAEQSVNKFIADTKALISGVATS